MNIDGANVLNENNDYKVFTMNSATSGQYCVVLPNNSENNMNMLVDLHMKTLFDGLTSGAKTKEELVEAINKEYLNVKGKYANSILVMPMLDEGSLNNSITNNDKQKMFDEVKKIGAITSEIYKKLTENGIDKNKISQQIVIVEKEENDNKFVSWLKEQMPNFVDGFNYEEPKKEESNSNGGLDINPFANTNSTVTPEPITEAPKEETPAPEVAVPNDLFESDTAAPEPVAEAPKEETPAPEVAVPNDLFGSNTAAPEQVAEAPKEETPAPEVAVPNDLFGSDTAAPEPVAEAPKEETPAPEAAPQTVEPTPAPTPEQVPETQSEIKPVESQELNGTTTFSPIVNTENNVENAAPGRAKSGGFANLLILLVILVGVTFISIELGKYLYSVYGA